MRAALVAVALLAAACGSSPAGPSVCTDALAVQDALAREPAFLLTVLGRRPAQGGVAPEPDRKTGQCATSFSVSRWPVAPDEADVAVRQVVTALSARGWTEVGPPRDPLVRGFRLVLDARSVDADVRFDRAAGEVRLKGRLASG